MRLESRYGTVPAPGARNVPIRPAVPRLDAAPLGCKWSLAILATLGGGACRTLALRRRIAGIRVKVLAECLRALEAGGYVARLEAEGYPRRVWYRLAPEGRRLVPVLRGWAAAGVGWKLAEMALKCRWTAEVMLALRDTPLRPADVRARVAGVGKRRLFERLAWLEMHGLVERRVVPSRPPATLHRLTPLGRRLAAGLARGIASGIFPSA